MLPLLISDANYWSRSGSRSRSRSRSRSGSGSRSGLGSRSRSGSWSWSWSRLGSWSWSATPWLGTFLDTNASAVWAAVANGDLLALAPLADRLEEINAMIPLEQGEPYFIRTPTFFYVGKVQSITPFGLTLAPGAYQANLLNDLPTFLATGELAEGDEMVPLPQGTIIPSLWIGPSDPFPFPMDWGRTNEPLPKRVKRKKP